jgi:hypothetical protein
MSIEEIDLSKPIPPRWRGSHRWGGWSLHGDHLFYGDYCFELDDTGSSASVLDMIMQIAMKKWATDECLAGLVHALDDIFHPQATLCSCGADKRMTAKQVKARLARARVMLQEERK